MPDYVDVRQPSAARVYDYCLGGRENFKVDRDAADAVDAVQPGTKLIALINRAFLGRAVRYLAEEEGIDQFLDIGSGLPTKDNVHQVAQRANPQARVVYVDNDPLVLVHARAMLTSSPEGRTAYLDADLREPRAILDDPELTGVLDFSQPVGLLLVAVLHFIRDDDNPREILATLIDALAPGSFVVASHATYSSAFAARNSSTSHL